MPQSKSYYVIETKYGFLKGTKMYPKWKTHPYQAKLYKNRKTAQNYCDKFEATLNPKVGQVDVIYHGSLDDIAEREIFGEQRLDLDDQ
jgi:hypothetical protein